mmetsp:Transcript_31042/g.64765  ORF Transcript_31042/g.64765 Transcript_31042/m.64765 type:complete len:239 (+) Transcript_31042:69-785(+)
MVKTCTGPHIAIWVATARLVHVAGNPFLLQQEPVGPTLPVAMKGMGCIVTTSQARPIARDNSWLPVMVTPPLEICVATTCKVQGVHNTLMGTCLLQEDPMGHTLLETMKCMGCLVTTCHARPIPRVGMVTASIDRQLERLPEVPSAVPTQWRLAMSKNNTEMRLGVIALTFCMVLLETTIMIILPKETTPVSQCVMGSNIRTTHNEVRAQQDEDKPRKSLCLICSVYPGLKCILYDPM